MDTTERDYIERGLRYVNAYMAALRADGPMTDERTEAIQNWEAYKAIFSPLAMRALCEMWLRQDDKSS